MPDYAELCRDHKCGECCRCINDSLNAALTAVRAERDGLRGALEAAKREAKAVRVDYNDRINGYIRRGGTVHDAMYHELSVRLDAVTWSEQRVAEVVDRALSTGNQDGNPRADENRVGSDLATVDETTRAPSPEKP